MMDSCCLHKWMTFLKLLEGGAMKVKVKNGRLEYSGVVVDVKSINYNSIIGYLPGANEKVTFPYEDVEFIFDHDWEKKIIKYRDILKLSLPRGVSPRFYAALTCAVEDYFKDEIRGIFILKDTNEKSRRRYWYKRIIIVINNAYPVAISASGREYSTTCNIDMEEIDAKQLALECREGIAMMLNIIGKSAEQLKFYEKVLYILENPGHVVYKAIEGK